MDSGLLDRGERGEVIARALIIEAYDRATLKARKEGDPLAVGCGVIGFIEELYTNHDLVLNAHPDNVIGGTTSFREAFKAARVRITQWVRVKDDHELSTETMAPAFIRGVAFICLRGQSFIDLIIPVLLWDEKIGESVMSAIFVQTKLRKDKGSHHITAEDFNFFSCSDSSNANTFPGKRPYITILMDLSIRHSLPEYARFPAEGVRVAQQIPAKENFPMIQTAPAATSGLEGKQPIIAELMSAADPTSLTTHPRYAIAATGCSSKVYAVIDKNSNQREQWQTLLHLHEDLLVDDSSPKGVVSSGRHMKPVWSLGPERYLWYDSDVLNRRRPGLESRGKDEVEGELYVSKYGGGFDVAGVELGGGQELDFEVGESD